MGGRSASKVSNSPEPRALVGWLVAACLAATGCGEEEPRPPPPKKNAAAQVQPAPSPPVPAPEPEAGPSKSGSGGAEEAARTLQRYHDLIGAGDYEAAQRLREKDGHTLADFAANFERYAEYRATVGQPSQVAEWGDWLYVEVPVQRYGKYKSGSAFANAGTVTLRRPKTGGPWRIRTSG